MVSGNRRRFLFLIGFAFLLSMVLSVAGPVVDAAIGRGDARALVDRLLGGARHDWTPRPAVDAGDLEDRQRLLRDLASDGRYVHTPTHIFDPLRDPALPALSGIDSAPAWPSKRGGNYLIVQGEGDFHDTRFEERIRATGAEIVGAAGTNSLIVRAGPLQQEWIASLGPVRWTGPFHPFYRIQPALLALAEGDGEERYLDSQGKVPLVLDLFPGERAADYEADVRALEGVSSVRLLQEQVASLSQGLILVADSRRLPAVLSGLSRLGGVRIVGGAPRVELLNNRNRWVHQTWTDSSDLDVAAKVHERGVTGYRQIVAVLDTGLENDNCRFRYGPDIEDVTYFQYRDPTEMDGLGQPLDNVDQPCNKVIAYYLSNNAIQYDPKDPGSVQHGTFVTGTLSGDNYQTDSGSNGLAAWCMEEPGTGDPILIDPGVPPSVHAGGGAGRYDGIAPGAQIVVQDRGGAPLTALDLSASRILEVRQAYDSGARFQNNSFGITNQSAYDTLHSLQMDDFLFSRRTMNVVWGSGDSGDEPPPTLSGYGAVAKNTITVGAAADGVTGAAMNLITESGRGPTADGRLKPEVTARSALRSASAVIPEPADIDPPGNPFGDSDCDTEETQEPGTSFSTPVVTGLAALTAQYFEDGYYPSGRATRGRWAVPGMRVQLDSGTPLQTDPAVNPDADRCTPDPSLCEPGDSFRPTNALVKAVLVNSTRNMTGDETGSFPGTADSRPNYGQGWGIPVLDDALWFEGDAWQPGGQRGGLLVLSDTPNGVFGDLEMTDVRSDVVHRFEPAFSNLDPIEIKEWQVTVVPGQPLVVTLSWSDPGEGSVAGRILRNDLDLEVIGPNPFDPGEEICWRPNPNVSYTGVAPDFVRDGWIQTETLIQNGEANLWLGKSGPVPSDKGLWPDFASADRFNNVEQIAIRASEVAGGTYTIRIVNWNIASAPLVFPDGEPDFEVDGKGVTGIGQDDVELDQQGFALVATGGIATDQGGISFDRPAYDCGPGQQARVKLVDRNGCADPDPKVVLTTTTPGPAFPSDYEVLPLTPEFPCDGGLPPDDPAQPKIWTTDTFAVRATNDPREVVQGDRIAELVPGHQMVGRYDDVDPAGGRSTARADLRCAASFLGDGWVIRGGCDLWSPAEPESPTNPLRPDQHIDAGELVEYTAWFINTGSRDLHDVRATLMQVDDRDADGSEVQVLDNPVYVGAVPAGTTASATFLVQAGQKAPAGPVEPMERVTLQVSLTSPADGLTSPDSFREEHVLEADNLVYRYSTRDPYGDLWGPGRIEERDPDHPFPGRGGADAFLDYDNMMIDPGPDGIYQTPDGVGVPQGDDEYSRNYTYLSPLGADDPWDFDDDEDGWTTYTDPVYDAADSGWFWAGNETGDNNTAGGCGWADNWERPVGEIGNGIWHTGEDGGLTIGGVHPQTSAMGLPLNAGPDPDRAYDDIYTAPNNVAPRVCATYKKSPDNGQPIYIWYLWAPRTHKVTRSPEFTVAWQEWTIYARIFGHLTGPNTDFSGFAALTHNDPLPSPISFREPELFQSFYAATTVGPFPENPVAGDWNDDAQNTFTIHLGQLDPSRPDKGYEDFFGPASPDGWEHGYMYWLQNTTGSPVQNRYGMGISDSAFIWTESRPVEDQSDCANSVQRPRAFFSRDRVSLCEGELGITVVDPNQPGGGSVVVNVHSLQEPPPGEVVELDQDPRSPTMYTGRVAFTVDPARDIEGVLLVGAGQSDTDPAPDAVHLEYDPREPRDGALQGVPDWLDANAPAPCGLGPDGTNDDFRNNCSVASLDELMDVSNMAPTPDDDGDTCPDGDGIPDAEDDCDALFEQDLSRYPECGPLQDACRPDGFEVNDTAWVNCPGGGVFYIRHEIIDIAGDGDRYLDRNEDVFLSVSVLNLRANDLENATVRISTEDTNLCILKDDSFYGDLTGVTTARLLGLDRKEQIVSTPPTHPVTGWTNYFQLGAPPETITADLSSIEKARIRVDIHADGFSTSGTTRNGFAPMVFDMPLDLDPVPNGSEPDFLETFCNASGAGCAEPPGKPGQPWYTESGFWYDPDSGIVHIDSRESWPDNGGFCPECDFSDPAECSTTTFDPPATEPPCDYAYDGTGPAGNPAYIDDWHAEEEGVDRALGYGVARSPRWSLHWGDHSILSYNPGQISALTLPPIHLSSDPACDPVLEFWQIASFWIQQFPEGLETPIGDTRVEINADEANNYPETAWVRLDPYEGNYDTYTDSMIACRGSSCLFHHPTFADLGDFTDSGDVVPISGRFEWTQADLSDYRGHRVKIRFLVSIPQHLRPLDGYRGWALDDIRVTCVGASPGYQLEGNPLPGPGPCGLGASFTADPGEPCLSTPVRFQDSHTGLGVSDGSGGREPIAYEWDFDGDTTPEIDCADGCEAGMDAAGFAGLGPNVAQVDGFCEAPLVTYAVPGSYDVTMTLCQGGAVQDSATEPVLVRADLDDSNLSVARSPVLVKGDPGCPATVPEDLNGDTVTDAADQAIWDTEYVGCAWLGTHLRSEVTPAEPDRSLDYCWNAGGEIVCEGANPVNFHRYLAEGAFADSVIVTDTAGGCAYILPMGIYIVPGPAFQVGNIVVQDDQCGNAVNDGLVDPGEYIRILVEVRNNGAGPAVELAGELRTPASLVDIHRAAGRIVGSVDPFVLGVGESGTVAFEFLAADTLPCMGVLDFDLDLYTWDRALEDTLNVTLPVGQSTPGSETCTDADLAGDVSGNPFVCDPGNGNDTSGCPSLIPDPTCCPSLENFPTDSACGTGIITDICVRARITMNGIGNDADEAVVTLEGPAGQSFPVLLRNPAGSGCQAVTIDLCTTDNLGDEGTSLCGRPPDRDQQYYEDFRAAFRNTGHGATYELRVEDAQKTSLGFDPGMFFELQEFAVDVDYFGNAACNPSALQDACLTDDDGPVFGGPFQAYGCDNILVQWLSAIDQEDMDGDERADRVPMANDVYRAEAASCDPADQPAPGDFTLLGSIADTTWFLDTVPAAGVNFYWYRVVSTDGGGHPSTGPPDVPNPDDGAHWACADRTGCPAPPPPPINLGPMGKGAGGGLQVPITSDTTGLAGVRLYRGTFNPMPGWSFRPSNQNHGVQGGTAGNCYEPPSAGVIGDSDPSAARYGTGSFYYMAVPLGHGTPYVEGSLDTEDFGNNGQVLPRVPPGNHDCN